MASNGQLSTQEVASVRQMLEGWPAAQRRLRTGTALKATRDGHEHRDTGIGDQGSGAPGHHARRGKLYLGDNDIVYINTSDQPGGTTWTIVGGGGVAGAHTLDDPVIHTDVEAQLNLAGDMLVRNNANPTKWDRLRNAPLNRSFAYLRGASPTPQWSDVMQPFHLRFVPPAASTISSGAITVSRSQHTIDTEGGAATDDLDTLNGMITNQMYLLRPLSGARTIVIKHGTGNLSCIGNADIILDDAHDFVLVFAATGGAGFVMSGGIGGGGGGGTTKYHFAYTFGGDPITGADFPPAT